MSMELAIAMKALKEAKNLEGSIEDTVRKYMEENPIAIDDTLTMPNMAADAKMVGDKIKSAIDKIYNARVLQATSKKEVDELFKEWWNYQYDESYSKSEMLERWFGNVLVDTRVHGEKQPLYTKSTSMIGELTDDSAGLVCTPSTESTAGNDPFAHLPQFWCLEVAAEKKQMVPMRFSMWNTLMIQPKSEMESICAGLSRRILISVSGRTVSINISRQDAIQPQDIRDGRKERTELKRCMNILRIRSIMPAREKMERLHAELDLHQSTVLHIRLALASGELEERSIPEHPDHFRSSWML